MKTATMSFDGVYGQLKTWGAESYRKIYGLCANLVEKLMNSVPLHRGAGHGCCGPIQGRMVEDDRSIVAVLDPFVAVAELRRGACR